MNKHPLDLNNLTTPDVDFSEAKDLLKRCEKIKKECEEEYGGNWEEHYCKTLNPDGHVDGTEMIVNMAIYEGHMPIIDSSPDVIYKTNKRYYEKLRELFGPLYKLHINHKVNDARTNSLLVEHALKTGKWRELPHALRSEYHKQAGKKKD